MAARAPVNLADYDDLPAAPAPGRPAPVNLADYDDVPARPKRGFFESLARGGYQGLTAGFGEEIDAAFRAAQDRSAGDLAEKYTKQRDKERAANKDASDDHPVAFGGAQLGGALATALIPGAGAARAASLGAAAGRGAVQGAATGLGSSDADLTKGDVVGAVGDVAKGAATGAIAGGAFHVAGQAASKIGNRLTAQTRSYAAKKLAEAQVAAAEAQAASAAQGGGKAAVDAAADAMATAEIRFGPLVAKGKDAAKAAIDPERARKAAAEALTDDAIKAFEMGTPGRSKVKIYGREGARKPDIERVFAEDAPLRAAQSRGPAEALEAVRSGGLRSWGEKIEGVYDRAVAASPGVGMKAVTKRLSDLSAEYAKTGATRPLAKVVEKETAAFFQAHAVPGAKGQSMIPLQALREEYRSWQNIAKEATKISGEKSPRGQVAERMANLMREALHEEIERSGGKALRAELADANRKFSAYASIEDVLSEKVTRERAFAPPMGELLSPLKDIRRSLETGAANVGNGALAGLHSIALKVRGGVQAMTGASAEAASGAGSAARAAAGPATGAQSAAQRGAPAAALARIVSALRTGAASPELIQRAVAAGVPRALIDSITRNQVGQQ